MNSLSLLSKVNKDANFGKDPEFRNFIDANNNKRCDSALSGDSYNSNSPGQKQESKAIVDLDLIVEKWIMYMWERTKTKQDAKFEFEELQVQVNWRRVEITQGEAKFDQSPSSRDLFAKPPKTQTLFRTYFTNNTQTEQEYSFKTERVTRQSCSFSFVKGFSREKEGGINFKIPNDIVEIGGGIRSEQSIECGKDQTKEEEVHWGVDSIIRVRPHCRTSASLVINELEFDRNFSLETKLKGRLVVSLTSKKDSTFFKSLSGDIVEIVSSALDKHWLPAGAGIFEIAEGEHGERYARALIKGVCKFRLGVEQHVTLDEESIKN